jgi:CheY-like chemotaxis protein
MPTVLVVDHDVPALGVVGALLTQQSCRVIFASSAAEALAAAREIPIDCVLTSSTLPDGTGEELKKTFRQDPALKRIGFFLMIGFTADATDFSRARGFIGKLPPTSMVHLLAASVRQGKDPVRVLAAHRAPRN